MFAVRDDEEAASAAGVNPLLARTGAMGLSALLTAIGGSLFAQYFQFLDPTHVVSPELSFQFALLPALGGLGTAIGPVLGAFAIMPLSEMLRSYLGSAFQGLHLAIYGGFLVVVMLYFPSGIAGALERLAAPAGRARHDALLEVRSLTRSFGALQAVAGVSFSVREGELLGLIGPNGAGKSTLYNLIAGAIAPTSGEIAIRAERSPVGSPIRPRAPALRGHSRFPSPMAISPWPRTSRSARCCMTRRSAAARASAQAVLAEVGLAERRGGAGQHPDSRPAEAARSGARARAPTAPRPVRRDHGGADAKRSHGNDRARRQALPARGIAVIWVEHVLYAIMKAAPRIIVLDRGE